jgi:hypothetical protein
LHGQVRQVIQRRAIKNDLRGGRAEHLRRTPEQRPEVIHRRRELELIPFFLEQEVRLTGWHVTW